MTNSIPVLTCMRKGCFRQLDLENFKTGYCNAHQPQPEIHEPDEDDAEALELQMLTPLGWVKAPVWFETDTDYTFRWVIKKWNRPPLGLPAPSGIYGHVPIYRDDQCKKCGVELHPSRFDIRLCKDCERKENEAEEMERKAQALGSANRRAR